MGTFAQVEARAPAKTLRVPPSAFADDWSGRPTDAVCCGLRLISAGDVFTARAEAARAAVDAHPDAADVDGRIEAYNDALMRWAVARGTCDPNDARASWDLWGDAPDDAVFEALTPEGARLIYRALHELHTVSDPSIHEATDDDVNAIMAELVSPTCAPERVRNARRFLSAAAEELGITPG